MSYRETERGHTHFTSLWATETKTCQADIPMKKIKQESSMYAQPHSLALDGRSLPQQNLDSELLVGAGGLVDALNLGIKPEASLIRCLHVVVDHHTHGHLELVPAQQGPGSRPHIHRSHLHHAVLWVTGAERSGGRGVGVKVCSFLMSAFINLILIMLSYWPKWGHIYHRTDCLTLTISSLSEE